MHCADSTKQSESASNGGSVVITIKIHNPSFIVNNIHRGIVITMIITIPMVITIPAIASTIPGMHCYQCTAVKLLSKSIIHGKWDRNYYDNYDP